MPTKLLFFASVAEVGTGLALIVDPRLVVVLLLGEELSGVGIPVARCFGIGLLALGLACWPSGANVRSDSPAFRAMLLYSVLIAMFLVYLFTVGHLHGVLLWPAAALHAAVALLLVKTWRDQRRTKARGT